MLYLTLLRHAKSSWDNPALIDFERPLSKRGRKDASAMAKALLQLGLPAPDAVVTSPSQRTLETLDYFIKAKICSINSVVKEDTLYESGVNEILDVINQQPENLKNLVLIGHNPGFTDLIKVLSGVNLGNLPTCGVATLGADCESWQEFTSVETRLLMLLTPKGIKRPKAG